MYINLPGGYVASIAKPLPKPRYRLLLLASSSLRKGKERPSSDVSWWEKQNDPNVPVEMVRCTKRGFKRY